MILRKNKTVLASKRNRLIMPNDSCSVIYLLKILPLPLLAPKAGVTFWAGDLTFAERDDTWTVTWSYSRSQVGQLADLVATQPFSNFHHWRFFEGLRNNFEQNLNYAILCQLCRPKFFSWIKDILKNSGKHFKQM